MFNISRTKLQSHVDAMGIRFTIEPPVETRRPIRTVQGLAAAALKAEKHPTAHVERVVTMLRGLMYDTGDHAKLASGINSLIGGRHHITVGERVDSIVAPDSSIVTPVLAEQPSVADQQLQGTSAMVFTKSQSA